MVLGDAFVRQHDTEWVVGDDQLGRDPALRYRHLRLFPMTISS